jgi:uncharacterized protein
MQFLLIAYDATDVDALNRRMVAREAHLALVNINQAKGHAKYGAAILDDSGKMIGSMMVVEYPDRAALDAWLAAEPYMAQKVWDKITIQPCKIAPSFVD